MVRNIGHTISLLTVNDLSPFTPYVTTTDTRLPLISIWSVWGILSPGFQVMPPASLMDQRGLSSCAEIRVVMVNDKKMMNDNDFRFIVFLFLIFNQKSRGGFVTNFAARCGKISAKTGVFFILSSPS
jgi:hypothetical protein